MKADERSEDRNWEVNSLSYSTNLKNHGISDDKSHVVISIDSESTFDEVNHQFP